MGHPAHSLSLGGKHTREEGPVGPVQNRRRYKSLAEILQRGMKLNDMYILQE